MRRLNSKTLARMPVRPHPALRPADPSYDFILHVKRYLRPRFLNWVMQVSFLKKRNVNKPAGSVIWVAAMDTAVPQCSGTRLLGSLHMVLSDPRSAEET